MKRYQILITRSAATDLWRIIEFVAKQSLEPALAQQLFDRIKNAIMGLDQMPTRYTLVTNDHLAALGIRKLAIDKYLVFYRVSESDKSVYVLRILHGRRDWEQLL